MNGEEHTITGVETALTAFIGCADRGPMDEPTPAHSFAEFEREFGGVAMPMSLAVQHYFANGGAEALIVRAERIRDSIAALDKVDFFNLLCLPGADDAETYTAAAAYCVARRAFLIVDAPALPLADVLTAAPALVTGEGKKNAAVFYPRLLPGDAVPCGAVAGIFGRTDRTRGVWTAPAGLEAAIAGADGLTVALDDVQSERLNAAGINGLRSFPRIGPVVWGSRTMETADDDWLYVPVRRLAIFLEESIDRGLTWTVSEPNGEPLWSEVRRSITAFLDPLWRQGAFVGATAREAYFVHCGRDTMTQEDLDNGILNVEIGFAPLRPAEFVDLRFRWSVTRPPDKP